MRIDLAKEPDFVMNAAIRVCPSRREVRAGGKSIVVEPRVMPVLVALHRSQGAVVSRDDLIESCWGARSRRRIPQRDDHTGGRPADPCGRMQERRRAALVDRIELEDYWRAKGRQPDFRIPGQDPGRQS